MRVATKFISSVLLLALALAAGTAWADTEPRQYFTASLTITTTQDEIENRPDTTSSGILYYDSTYPGVRFEAHTTPDHAGDGTPTPHPLSCSPPCAARLCVGCTQHPARTPSYPRDPSTKFTGRWLAERVFR